MRYLVICLLLMVFSSAQAVDLSYEAPIDTAKWEVAHNKLVCKMTQNIPDFGNAFFLKEAGRPIELHLHSKFEIPDKGRAFLYTKPAPWQHNVSSQDLGNAKLYGGKNLLKVKAHLTRRVISSLQSGYIPGISYAAPQSGTDLVRVNLSPLKFKEAYAKYLNCIDNLLPYSFDDVKFTTIQFRSDSYELTPEAIKKLNDIKEYALADKRMVKLVVRGYSDSLGAGSHNAFLSTSRVDMVEQFLATRGIEATKIESYAHSAENPVASNRSPEGRAMNRRVTIELKI